MSINEKTEPTSPVSDTAREAWDDALDAYYDAGGTTHDEKLGNKLARESIQRALDAAVAQKDRTIAELRADVDRLVRKLDVIWNGEEGAAKQASFCDIVSQIGSELPALRAELQKAHDEIGNPGHLLRRARGAERAKSQKVKADPVGFSSWSLPRNAEAYEAMVEQMAGSIEFFVFDAVAESDIKPYSRDIARAALKSIGIVRPKEDKS